MKSLTTLAALALLTACSTQLEGPAPSLPGEPGTDSAPVTPGFVCNAQLETWVSVTGSGFSPAVLDAVADDREPRVVLPRVQLFLAEDLDGVAASAPVVEITGSEGSDSRVLWEDSGNLRFLVTPDDGLEPGVYGVVLVNPDGQRAVVPAGFAAVERPFVHAVDDELACVAQAGRELVVTGTGFLARGDSLPTVRIGEQTYVPSSAAGCESLPATFGDWETCTTLTVTVEEGDLEPGVHRTLVTNPSPAGCSSLDEDDVALTVVPPPTVADILPEPTCGQQLDYEMRVTGTGFVTVTVDGTSALPTVQVGDQLYTPTAVSECEPIDSLSRAEAETCTELVIQVAAGDLPAADHPVRVVNPAPALCTSTDDVDLTTLPPPVLDGVSPLPVCTAQGDVELTLAGRGFLTIAGAAPTVLVNGESYPSAASACEPVPGPEASTETCTQLSVTIPQGRLAEGGQFEVHVQNPETAHCSTTDSATLVTVPPPTLTGLEPNYACLQTAPGDATLRGEGLLRVDGVGPTVTVDGTEVEVSSLEDCAPLDGAPGVEVCGAAVLVLPEGVAAGELAVTATNPAPAACSAETQVTLFNLEPPTVQTATPTFFCSVDDGVELSVAGQNFYAVDGELPAVVIGDQTLAATAVDDCTEVEGPEGDLQVCGLVTATLPAGVLAPAAYPVSVVGAAGLACPASEEGPLVVVAGAPAIETYLPLAVCRGQFDGEMTIRGTGFFRIDGQNPTVTANGEEVVVLGMDGCAEVPTAPGVEACTGVDIQIPEALREQDLGVALTNPAPADCAVSTIDVPLEEPPVIADVNPQKICAAGGALDLTGDHFAEGMVVSLDGVEAEEVIVHSPTSATATWAGPLEPGLATLVAVNPSGCTATFETEIRVTEGPVVFFVDPPVLYNGVSIQVTVFLGNLYGGSVTQVLLTADDETMHELEFVFDPEASGRVQAIVPSGLAPGSYDVSLVDDVDCLGTTEDLVLVTDETRVSLAEVFPPFGATDSATGIALTTADPIPDGEVGFVPTPRVYLNPSDVMPGDLAVELRASGFVSPNELTGIVGEGLPPGSYDVIVVNPDATVGVLTEGFAVTQLPPPTIASVSPGSWETNNPALRFEIIGANFREGEVSGECLDSGGNPLPAPAFAVAEVMSDSILADVDTSSLAHLAVCVLRVSNADGTFEEFGPVTVTNPAGNFVAFRAGNGLTTARRAPAVVGAAPARRSRFVYALGGDDGTDAGVLATGEYGALNRFGEVGAWNPLPHPVPASFGATRAVRVADFLYVVAGRDADGATASVWRALVLDPLFTPAIDGVDFEFTEEDDSFDEGVYYYRVAAVMADDDANPGGESLASEAQPLFVPDLDRGVRVVIAWTAVEGAASYRVYRSTTPNAPSGSERLVATTDAQTLTWSDDGSAEPQDAQPLPIGALGVWEEIATIPHPRYDHGVAVTRDPGDPDTHHIYAVGGTNGDALIEAVDIVTIGVLGPRSQSVSTRTSGELLPSPRRGLEVVVADPSNASSVPGGTAWLYMLSGSGARNVTDVHVARIMSGGELGTPGTTERLRPFRTHYAAASANNTLVALGGQGGSPSASGASSGLDGPSGDLLNWNSLGNTGLGERVYMGRAVFGGFFYLVGGSDPNADATTTLEFSILGGVP